MKPNAVKIKTGTFEGNPVQDVVFALIRDYHPYAKGGGFYLVDGKTASEGEYPSKPIRVKVSDPSHADYIVLDGAVKKKEVYTETDEEAIDRIRERFEVLTQMTEATQEGNVRAMIVSGPPGVGKSYGVEEQLNKSDILYKFSNPGNILVLDDCDTVLFDDVSLNILKAALDSSKKRYISWNSESRVLANEGVPDRFEYKGSVIMITNIKFNYVKSKKLQDHLAAIMSRCHYLDLTMDSSRDKFLRCKQIVKDGNMLSEYGFSEEEGQGLIQFMEDNKEHLNEISLRMVTKLADLKKMSDDWQKLARVTCMKRGAQPGYAGTKFAS